MTNENQLQNTSSCCADCESEQHVIAEGTVKEFDIAKGEITFDGDLFNKGKIVIRSSDPTQASATIRVTRLLNEGEIVCEVPSLTVYCEGAFGPGATSAPESIAIHGTAKDLNIIGGSFAAEKVKLDCNGKLNVHVRRIDAAVYIAACDLAYGVSEGNINVVENKVSGDPLIYNAGGDVSSFPIQPSDGSDIIVVASGNVSVGSLDSTSASDFAPGRIQLIAGRKFKQPANNIVELGCVDCIEFMHQLPPGHGFEGTDDPYNPDANVIVNGDLNGKSVAISGRDITVNGNIFAQGHGTQPFGPGVLLTAWNSLTVSGTIKTNQTVQWPQTGSVAIEAPTCTVGGKITADIVIVTHNQLSDVTSGTLETAAIEARRNIVITAGNINFDGGGGGARASSFASGDYNVKTGKLTAKHSIEVLATGTIDTGAIELLENTDEVIGIPHYVRIHANVFKENAPQLFVGGGGTGPASIKVHGTARIFENINYGSIMITNGISGDITINGDQIFVTSEQEGTPDFMAAAGAGRITVKGTLKVDGTASVAAGSVALIADEIRSTAGATISANDQTTASERVPPRILLVTSKLTLAGNLTAQCEADNLPSVKVVPKGSVPSSTEDFVEHFQGSFFLVDNITVNTSEEQVLATGAGNLLLKAKGDSAAVTVSGKPLKFNNSGTSDLIAEGDGSLISIDFAGEPSGQNSLVFGGGAVTLNASNPNGDAGEINIRADKVANTAASVALKANSVSNGNGGAIVVSVDRGNLALGSAANAISMSATSNSGNGGSITVENAQHNGTLTLDSTFSEAAMTVAALGSNGDGGIISLHSDHLVNNTGNPNLAFLANGAGSGEGGTVDFTLTDAIQLTAANGLAFKAEGGSSGNGGNVSVKSTQGSVTIEGVKISVHGGTNGKGGNITVRAPQSSSTLKITGTMNANGDGNGKGGEVVLKAGGTLDIGQGTLQANGGPRGAGGLVDITSGANLTVQSSQISAQAGTGPGSNAGGRIKISTTDDATLTVQGTLDVKGVSAAKGGSIVVSSSGNLDLSQASLIADGGTSGNGGTIRVECASGAPYTVKDLSATAGSATGGEITIASTDDADLDVKVVGSVDTSAQTSEEYSGKLTLEVSDVQANSISLLFDEGSSFASLLSAEGKSFSFAALPVINLGIDSIQANDGDIHICNDGTTSCAVAVLPAVGAQIHRNRARKLLLQDPTKIGVKQTLRAPNGGIILSSETFQAPDADNDLIVTLPGESRPVAITCSKLHLGSNRYIFGSQLEGGNVSIHSLGNGLELELSGGSKAGIKGAKSIVITAGGANEALNFTKTAGSGTLTVMALQADSCIIFADGPVFSQVDLGMFNSSGGTIDSSLTPDEITISSSASFVDLLAAKVTALSKVNVNTSNPANGNIGLSTVVAGDATSPGEINVNSARDLQLDGTKQASGPISFFAAHDLEVFGTVKALNSGGFASEKVTFQALGAIGFLNGSSIQAHDEIIVTTQASFSKTNPDAPGSRPATVNSSQISLAGGGQLYWGNTAFITVNADNTPTFSTNGKDLTFDAASVNSFIGIDTHVVFATGA